MPSGHPLSSRTWRGYRLNLVNDPALQAVAPVFANPRECAGRVKTAQRRRAVLTRSSAPAQSRTGATAPYDVNAV